MADSETPVVATDTLADINVEVEEPQQEVKLEENLNKTQEQAAEQVETVDVKQEEEPVSVKQEESVSLNQDESVDIKQNHPVDVKQDEPVGLKQDEPVDAKQEGTKQEEVVADVKKNAEIKDEAAIDATADSKAVTDKKVTGGGHKKRVFENKSMFDPTVLPDSDDPEEVRKQVEFYFSESNLSSDKFLFGLVGGKENKPVSLNLIASFKRMKRFPNKETIINALKESTVVELGGDPGEETVKRKIPVETAELMPGNRRFGVGGGRTWPKDIANFEPNQDPAIHRSIYAKGFDEETATTQIDLEKFFEPYGPLNSVRLRRDNSRKFKKSIFVEFANDELARNFMALEKKPVWEDKELLWLSKLAYVQGKVQDIKDGKVQPKSRPDTKPQRSGSSNGGQHKHNGSRSNDRNGRGGSRGGRGGRGRGGRGGRGGDRRGGDRDNKRGDREGFKKEDNGIPKIKSSADAVKSEPTDTPTNNGASKRKATDDGAQEVKKTKAGETSV